MSETPSSTPGTVAWFELPAENTKRSQEFSARLFGWEFEPFGIPKDFGSFAHCRDTEGNAFSLYQAGGGDR
jgi:predicted enzyme related to lactoylglutathione lyase